MKSTDTTNQMFELLTADDEVKDVYDRQKSIIKLAELVRSLRRKADMTQRHAKYRDTDFNIECLWQTAGIER